MIIGCQSKPSKNIKVASSFHNHKYVVALKEMKKNINKSKERPFPFAKLEFHENKAYYLLSIQESHISKLRMNFTNIKVSLNHQGKVTYRVNSFQGGLDADFGIDLSDLEEKREIEFLSFVK